MRTARGRRLRDLSLGLGAIVVAMLTVVAIVWVNIGVLEAADHNDAEAREEVALCDSVLDAVIDQENAMGGLVATHDPRYIAPYQEGRERLESAMTSLARYAADDSPDQRAESTSAALLAKRWATSFAEPKIAAVRAGRAFPATSAAEAGDLAAVSHAISNLREGEVRLLHDRDAAQAAAYGASRLALLLGAGAALAFAIVILGRTARQLIVERRLAEDSAARLERALESAQAAERAKARFLANMSHEMRTPLNGVSGMADALANTRLDAPQREMVDAIQFSSVTLDQLIGDLLALSRREDDGRAEPAAASFQLAFATRAATAPFATQARVKGLAFQVEIAPDAEVAVIGDAPRLSQTLACLLSNAMKFTDQGAVRLSVRKLDNGRFCFEVADTGVGFDQAREAQLFETFSQSDDSDTRRHGGAGLGLALAKRLTAELGGALEAQSSPGAGSCFRFEIALAPAPVEAGNPPTDCAEPDAGGADEPVRVLVVDDNATNRKVLELILAQVGAEWTSVENGLQAVEAASATAFTAILMDIQMPVMDGLAATREIRRLERENGRPAAPVIIVSASCQPEHIAAGEAAGAQAHLGKPVSAQAVLDALRDVLAVEALAAGGSGRYGLGQDAIISSTVRATESIGTMNSSWA